MFVILAGAVSIVRFLLLKKLFNLLLQLTLMVCRFGHIPAPSFSVYYSSEGNVLFAPDDPERGCCLWKNKCLGSDFCSKESAVYGSFCRWTWKCKRVLKLKQNNFVPLQFAKKLSRDSKYILQGFKSYPSY